MSNVTKIAPHLRAINAPSELRRHPAWLGWRYEQYSDEPKPRKIPYYADGTKRYGQQGSQLDRAKLSTFEAARDAAIRYGFDGVGFAPMPEWNITALDFDGCVGADQPLPDEIACIVSGTYAEYSPSGKGIRAFVKGNFGNHKSGIKNHPYGFETFATSGFVTVTGNMLAAVELLGNEDTVAEASDVLLNLCAKRFERTDGGQPIVDADNPWAGHEPRLGLTPKRIQELLDQLDPDISRDEWIRVGMALHHECEGDDTGFDFWNDWSSMGEKYPSEEGLRSQWESFTRRMGPGRRQVTMASVIRMVKEAGGGSAKAATPEELKAAVEGAARASKGPLADVRTPDGFNGKYPMWTAEAVSLRPPPSWLITGVVPKADLVVMFGPSGAGKSFVALDIAIHIARGEPWRERRTKKGRVAIIAAEGGGGFGKRLQAYCTFHNIDIKTLDVGVILAAPDFLEREEIIEIVTTISAAGDIDLIIVDTFAQVTAGANENAGEDMGLALRHCRSLREATGAVVMLIHHAGKDASKGARGWSGIKAAADAELEIIKHETGGREIRVSKMKDGEDNLAWGFKLENFALGFDEQNDAITSCVVVPTDVPKLVAVEKERKNVRKVGKLQAHVLDMIETIDPKIQSMRLDAFITFCVDGMPVPEDITRDTRRQNIMRTVQAMARGVDAPITIEQGIVIFGV